jgi:O-succinylbenzoate synthase
MSKTLAICRFFLEPKAGLNAHVRQPAPREGAILAHDGGFASLVPWPEFGDEPLHQQLIRLSKGAPLTPLLQAALNFAQIDAQARSQKRSLFEGLQIPTSHYLITDPALWNAAQYPTPVAHMKLKLTGDPLTDQQRVLQCIPLCLQLRLDANAAYTFDTFLTFWSSLTDTTKKQIEFIEDPVPYNAQHWQQLSSLHQVPLAYDFYASSDIQDHYQVRILKPMVQHYQSIAAAEIARGRKLVITSTLDHPLGVSAAAWVSAELYERYPNFVLAGGYASFSAYKPDPFSLAITRDDGLFRPAEGTGFGFDEILSQCRWETLSSI